MVTRHENNVVRAAISKVIGPRRDKGRRGRGPCCAALHNRCTTCQPAVPRLDVSPTILGAALSRTARQSASVIWPTTIVLLIHQFCQSKSLPQQWTAQAWNRIHCSGPYGALMWTHHLLKNQVRAETAFSSSSRKTATTPDSPSPGSSWLESKRHSHKWWI